MITQAPPFAADLWPLITESAWEYIPVDEAWRATTYLAHDSSEEEWTVTKTTVTLEAGALTVDAYWEDLSHIPKVEVLQRLLMSLRGFNAVVPEDLTVTP